MRSYRQRTCSLHRCPEPPPPGSGRFVNFGCFHCVAISWLNQAGTSRALEPIGDDASGGCARCFGTRSRLSAWPWQLLPTTVLVRRRRCRCRTAPHGDRRPPPGPGRWRSKLRTPACGHRRLLHRECGRASLRSPGRRDVTAA